MANKLEAYLQNASDAPDGLRRIAPLSMRLPSELSHFRPRDLAERVRELNPLARIEGVKLTVRITRPTDESRFGDRDRVLQLTTSLVSLAVRYSTNGTVNFNVDRSEDRQLRLFLTFSDIREAARNQQLLWSDAKATGATLQSVIRDFVHLGAKVGIAAGLRDQTEVCIILPQATIPTVPQELSGMNILLVGEAVETLMSIYTFLVSLGATVSKPSRGRLSEACPDAVIVDVDSVDDAGATLFQVRETARLRGQRQAASLALIGSASREDIERYFCVGFDALAFKPLCSDEICKKLRTII